MIQAGPQHPADYDQEVLKVIEVKMSDSVSQINVRFYVDVFFVA